MRSFDSKGVHVMGNRQPMLDSSSSEEEQEEEEEVGMTDDDTINTEAKQKVDESKMQLIPWIHDTDAKKELFSVFTCFYALLLFIIGLVLELSNLLDEQPTVSLGRVKELIFSVFMYGGSLIFFIYCYVVLLNSRVSRNIVNSIRRATERSLTLNSPFVESKSLTTVEKEDKMRVVKSPTGSLYLRLGCVVFGIFGVVYYGLVIMTCILGWGTEQSECNTFTLISASLATLFIFVQMHFIFCNSKLTSTNGSVEIARLGMMHLIATNLWTWMRYILIEELATTVELSHTDFATTHFYVESKVANISSIKRHPHQEMETCRGANCVLGTFSEFMYTCVVEYALICAGVSIVFWTSLGKGPNEYQKNKQKHRSKKNIILVDCSQTTTGLFLGFLIIAFTFVCIAIFNAYIYHHDSELLANTIFFTTDGILLFLSLLAILFAFFRMRNLSYKKRKGDIDESAELLDRILLVVGLIGQLIFSIGGIMSLLNSAHFNYMLMILISVQFLRLFQVILQSALLLIGSKLQTASTITQVKKPGKQVITFLLISNIALFIMNTFEAQKAGVTENIVRFYGSKAWALLVRGCSPLTIFYRFHSSVCFAEIWKHSFKSASGELSIV